LGQNTQGLCVRIYNPPGISIRHARPHTPHGPLNDLVEPLKNTFSILAEIFPFIVFSPLLILTDKRTVNMGSYPQTQPMNASWQSLNPATDDKYAGSLFKTQPFTLSPTTTTQLAPVASPSPRVSGTNALGLSLLSRLDDEHLTTTGADIIAIHGIHGHAHYTWTVDSNGGPLWLRDFLPHEIPGARVYSFGYDSRVLFSKANWDLTSISRSFLAQLVAARRGWLRHRPLVFLCHSMGGLVLKQVCP
jgi:hypothetical protein